VCRVLETWFAHHGLTADRRLVDGERANLVARVQHGEGPTVMLNGHLDTVPAGAMRDAFLPRRKGDTLWGRGACDMKGAIAAMAVVPVAAARNPGQIDGTLLFAGTIDEESGSLGVRALLDGGVRADYAVVGEPTSLRVAIAHKGSCVLRIQLMGRGAHGSCPEEGVNAAVAGARLARAIHDELASRLRNRTHPLLGCATVSVGRLCGGTQPNIVAERCELDVDRRLLPGEDNVIEELRDVATSICGGIDGLTYCIHETAMTSAVPHVPLGTDPEAVVSQAARSACRRLGLDPAPIGVAYWTDGGHLAARGIETIVVGPGDIRFAHGPEEHVAVDQLVHAAELYAQIATSLLSPEDRGTRDAALSRGDEGRR
jgi:acetylornithine deacetylase/succinyl-diaminopimelate desuccinylase-like protein